MTMAVHGKNTKVFINGRHLSSEFDSFDLTKTADTADGSHFDAASKEFEGGQTSASLNLGGLFLDTATAADAVLADAIGDASVWCVFPEGDAAGKAGHCVVGKNTSHQVMSTRDDLARITAACQGETAERIISLLTLSTVTSTGTGATHDNGASSANGGAIVLQATAVTGSVLAKVEHSADGTSWADLAAFAAVSTVGAQRVAVAGTINRYTRIAYTLDGGESITLQASIHRA
jgi:hypothetical protein